MILAIDFGDRFIGLAAAQPPDMPAHRLGVIDQSKEDAIRKIQEIVLADNVTRVLIGMPISLSGEETEQTHKTLIFMEKLREALSAEIDIDTIDETLTSAQASRIISAEGGRAEDEHAESARLILTDYIGRQRSNW